MTIPSRACAPLINTIQATTTAVAIRTAEDIPPAQATATIRDRALVPDLDLLTVVQDLDLTVAAAMTIITVANRRSCSESASFAAIFVDANIAAYCFQALDKKPKPYL